MMLILNQPGVLATLFVGSLVLVLLDYLLPIDWLAYVGYACFALFIGATAPATPAYSVVVVAVVFGFTLLLHEFFFAHYLTNAPKHETKAAEDSEGASRRDVADTPTETS